MLDSKEIRQVNPAHMAKIGAKGGKSTWAKMTPEQRTERAHKMLLAREAKRAARRLKDDLR